jgi:hypothetical protein
MRIFRVEADLRKEVTGNLGPFRYTSRFMCVDAVPGVESINGQGARCYAHDGSILDVQLLNCLEEYALDVRAVAKWQI